MALPLIVSRSEALLLDKLFKIEHLRLAPVVVLSELLLRAKLVLVLKQLGVVLSLRLQAISGRVQVLSNLILLAVLDLATAKTVGVEPFEQLVNSVLIAEVVVLSRLRVFVLL